MVLRRNDVAPIGRVATGSRLWTTQNRLHLTVIVKATYNFRLGGDMSVTEAQPLTLEDIHYGGQSGRSVRQANDLAPYLRQADIVFAGQAYAPKGQALGEAKVRLAVHGDRPLLDKRLLVYGDRKLLPSGPSTPLPFKRMPIVYGRAVGNVRPGGGRMAAVGGATGALANIIDPAQPDQCAGFGALSKRGRQHRHGLSTQVCERLEQRIMDIPSSFDWSYFQVAPRDQRTPFLQGNEWLKLEGLDPSQLHVQTRLPSAAAAAWVWPKETPGDAGWTLPMHADTLAIDADAGRCTLTWRACFPVASEGVVEALHIAAGVQYPDQPIDWPVEIAQVEKTAAESAPSSPVVVDLFGTVNIVELGSQATAMVPSRAGEGPQPPTGPAVLTAPQAPADPLMSTIIMDPPEETTPGRPDAAEDPLASTIGTSFQPLTPATPFVAPAPTAPNEAPASDPLASTIGTSLLSQDPATPWEDQPRRPRRPPSDGPQVAAMPWDEPTSTDDDEPDRASEASPGGSEPAVPPLLPSMGNKPIDLSVAARLLAPLPLPLPAQPADLFGTVTVGELSPSSTGAHFQLADSTGATPTLQPAAFPGAPWSDDAATPVTAPSTDPLASTLTVSDVLSPAAGRENHEPTGLGADFLAAIATTENTAVPIGS